MKKQYIALTLAIIMALLTLSSCIEYNNPSNCSEEAFSSSAEKITYMMCDWPYYNTLQSLCDAATDILKEKCRIFSLK